MSPKSDCLPIVVPRQQKALAKIKLQLTHQYRLFERNNALRFMSNCCAALAIEAVQRVILRRYHDIH